MNSPQYNLAIETSCRRGSVALGCDDQLLACRDLPEPRRHRVDLVPTLKAICQEHQVKPTDLKQLYLSVGPGSFTGLRIAATTAKMLAHVTGAKIMAIPTLDVLAEDQPPPTVSPVSKTTKPTAATATTSNQQPLLVICLNHRHQTAWTGTFHWERGRWRPLHEPALMDEAQLAQLSQGAILCPLNARPTAEATWRLGRRYAKQSRPWTSPERLSPIYARPPEAVKLWEQNKHRRITQRT